MLRKIVRVRHVGALLACVTIASACSSPPPPQQHKSEQKQLELTPLDGDTCEGIFDDSTLAELKNLDVSRVYVPGAGRAFFDTFTSYMNKSMKPSNPRLTHGCVIRDKTGKETLIDITVDWGSNTFPAAAERAGKVTSYAIDSSSTGKQSDQLLVNCRRPDLARKAKKALPVQVSMTNTLNMSPQSRVSLLNGAANEVTEGLYCENKVSYPEPDQVIKSDQ